MAESLAEPAPGRSRPARSRRALAIAVGTLVFLAVLALFAPQIAPFSPREQFGDGHLLPPLTKRQAMTLVSGQVEVATRIERVADGWRLTHRDRDRLVPAGRAGPDPEIGTVVFLLGTDHTGRDVFSRLLYGARLSLSIAVLAVVLMMTVGIAVGTAAALGGRLVDALLMRLVDGIFAFPIFFLLIALTAIFDPSITTLVLVLGLTSWMTTSRMVRAELMSLRDRDFVVAARGLGAGPLRIVFRHLLPHITTTVLIQATFAAGGVVVTEAALSFFDLGVQAPDASWGNLIQDGRAGMVDFWWIATFPALALAITVIALNVIGDALRDRLDPALAP